MSISYCVPVYLSNLILKVDVDFADTTSWGKLFQILITLEFKKCCLMVVLTLGLNNLDVCPLVILPDSVSDRISTTFFLLLLGFIIFAVC